MCTPVGLHTTSWPQIKLDTAILISCSMLIFVSVFLFFNNNLWIPTLQIDDAIKKNAVWTAHRLQP